MRDQAHRTPSLPSTVRYGRIWREPADRTDPGYDRPGPPRRSDLSWWLIVESVLVFLAICMFVFLASLVEVGS